MKRNVNGRSPNFIAYLLIVTSLIGITATFSLRGHDIHNKAAHKSSNQNVQHIHKAAKVANQNGAHKSKRSYFGYDDDAKFNTASNLAEALRAIEMSQAARSPMFKGHPSQDSISEEEIVRYLRNPELQNALLHEYDPSYYDDTWDYNGYEKSMGYGDDDDDDYDYSSEEAVDVLRKVSPGELRDIMGDENEPNNDVKETPEASSEELTKIFGNDQEENVEKEKKDVNWAPRVLGTSGLKRGANKDENVQAYDGELHELSKEEVEQLLGGAKDAMLQSVQTSVQMSNVDGKEEATATQIQDILADEGNGKTQEIIVKQEVPVEEAQEMSNAIMEEQEEGMEEAQEEINENLKQMAALTREVFDKFQEKDSKDYFKKAKRSNSDAAEWEEEKELAKQCLLDYILLEDEENTNLAAALDWASRAQYENTDEYIKFQIYYLRLAMQNEKSLQKLQEGCLKLLGISYNEGDDDEEEEVEEEASQENVEGGDNRELPMNSKYYYEGRPRKREGEQLPMIVEDDSDGYDFSDEGVEYRPQVSEDEGEGQEGVEEYTLALAEKLKKYLSEQKQQQDQEEIARMLEGAKENEVWYREPVKEKSNENQEWALNPIIRQLVRKPEQELEDQPDLEALFEESLLDEEGDECPALDLMDNCAFAPALGWSLDEEALELCNRHQLCYACGEAHKINAEHCDFGYQIEAYRACEEKEDELSCIEDADQLYKLMVNTHVPVYNTRLQCKAQCVSDYITGEYYRKK